MFSVSEVFNDTRAVTSALALKKDIIVKCKLEPELLMIEISKERHSFSSHSGK